MSTSQLERCTVTIDRRLLERYDRLLEHQGYPSRSEGIRDLVRKAVVEEDWGSASSKVAATVTIVFNHHQRELSERLDHLQHHHTDIVVSKTHVHLDEENCLEVIILRGKCRDVQALAGRLVAERGVKHGEVVHTSAGEGLW